MPKTSSKIDHQSQLAIYVELCWLEFPFANDVAWRLKGSTHSWRTPQVYWLIAWLPLLPLRPIPTSMALGKCKLKEHRPEHGLLDVPPWDVEHHFQVFVVFFGRWCSLRTVTNRQTIHALFGMRSTTKSLPLQSSPSCTEPTREEIHYVCVSQDFQVDLEDSRGWILCLSLHKTNRRVFLNMFLKCFIPNVWENLFFQADPLLRLGPHVTHKWVPSLQWFVALKLVNKWLNRWLKILHLTL